MNPDVLFVWQRDPKTIYHLEQSQLTLEQHRFELHGPLIRGFFSIYWKSFWRLSTASKNSQMNHVAYKY